VTANRLTEPGSTAAPLSAPRRHPLPEGTYGRSLLSIARWLAIGGGVVLSAIALLTVFSILGREVIGQPIAGDFEIVEIGCAVSIFCFLPYCHLTRGNIVVALFTERASARTRAALEAIGDTLFAVIAAVLTWRLALGGLDLYQFGQETMVLRIPMWVGFAVSVVVCAFLTLACTHTAGRAWRACRTGDEPSAAGIDR
jgi:TRAP-type C4-dicarboxylate transport system permease small subunit